LKQLLSEIENYYLNLERRVPFSKDHPSVLAEQFDPFREMAKFVFRFLIEDAS